MPGTGAGTLGGPLGNGVVGGTAGASGTGGGTSGPNIDLSLTRCSYYILLTTIPFQNIKQEITQQYPQEQEEQIITLNDLKEFFSNSYSLNDIKEFLKNDNLLRFSIEEIPQNNDSNNNNENENSNENNNENLIIVRRNKISDEEYKIKESIEIWKDNIFKFLNELQSSIELSRIVIDVQRPVSVPKIGIKK